MSEEINKVDWINLILKTISSIISGSIIVLVSLYIWHQQNNTSQQQKLYETKIETLKKFTEDGGKMIHYSEFMIRTKLELYQLLSKEISKELDVTKNTKLTPDYYEKTMRNQLRLQQDKPILYAQYMKGLEFQSEFQSSMLLAKTFFEPYAEFDSLQSLFSENIIVEKVKLKNNGDILNIQNLDKEIIIIELRNEQLRLFSKIVESLFYQIKYPEKFKIKD